MLQAAIPPQPLHKNRILRINNFVMIKMKYKCMLIIPFWILIAVEISLSISHDGVNSAEIEEEVANKIIQRWKRQLELPGMEDILLDTEEESSEREKRKSMSMSNWGVLSDPAALRTQAPFMPAAKERAKGREKKTWGDIQKERNKKFSELAIAPQSMQAKSAKSSAAPSINHPTVRLASGDWCGQGQICAGEAECVKKLCTCRKPLNYGTSCKRTDGSFFGALVLPSGFFTKPKTGLGGSAKEWKTFRQLENKAHKVLRAIEDTMTLKSGAKCNKDLEGKVDGVLQYFGNLQKIVEKDFNKYADQAGKLVGKKKEQICDRRKLLKCVDGTCSLMLQGSVKGGGGKPIFQLNAGVKCGKLPRIYNSYYEFKCAGKEKCGCDNKDEKMAVPQWNSEFATTPKPKPKPKAAPSPKKPVPPTKQKDTRNYAKLSKSNFDIPMNRPFQEIGIRQIQIPPDDEEDGNFVPGLSAAYEESCTIFGSHCRKSDFICANDRVIPHSISEDIQVSEQAEAVNQMPPIVQMDMEYEAQQGGSGGSEGGPKARASNIIIEGGSPVLRCLCRDGLAPAVDSDNSTVCRIAAGEGCGTDEDCASGDCSLGLCRLVTNDLLFRPTSTDPDRNNSNRCKISAFLIAFIAINVLNDYFIWF